MKAKIAKWGNSVALRVPRGLAEDLGLMPGKMDLTSKEKAPC